jgi:hypothetical protein
MNINGAMLTCGEEVQAAGHAGLISPEVCAVVQVEAVDTCGCFDPVCDICDGLPILNPGSFIMINGLNFTCEEAEDFGNAGLLPPNTCIIAQAEAQSSCGCIAEDTRAPGASVSPSVSPSAVPTLVIGQNIDPADTPNGPTGDPRTPTGAPSAAHRTSGMVGVLLLSLLTWFISL